VGYEPPRPGISARGVGGDRVEFRYSLTRVPAACKARFLVFQVDVSSDDTGGFEVKRAVNDLAGSETIEPPALLRGADVATAYVIAESGLTSPRARVKIS
jgi:hypothetical protein